LRAADTLLLGRISYNGFKDYWPCVADDPNNAPVQREISQLNNAIDKVVISDSLTSTETAPWHNTRIIRHADAYHQIAERSVTSLSGCTSLTKPDANAGWMA